MAADAGFFFLLLAYNHNRVALEKGWIEVIGEKMSVELLTINKSREGAKLEQKGWKENRKKNVLIVIICIVYIENLNQLKVNALIILKLIF